MGAQLSFKVDRRKIVDVEMNFVLINVLIILGIHLSNYLAQLIKLLGHFLLNLLGEVLPMSERALDLLRVLWVLVVEDLTVRVLEHRVNILIEEHVLLLQFVELLLQGLRVPLDLDCVEAFEDDGQEVPLCVDDLDVLQV